jgi:hypothetical protein
MDQQVQTVLTKFDIAQTSKGPIFKLFDQYGTEYATFVQAVFDDVKTKLGHSVVVTYDTRVGGKQGQYEDRYIKGAVLVNGQAQSQPTETTQMQPMQAQGTVPVFPGQTSTTDVPIAGPEYQRPKHPDDVKSIHRCNAMTNAVGLLAYLKEPLTDPAQLLAIEEMIENHLNRD